MDSTVGLEAPSSLPRVCRFGSFEIDVDAQLLRRDGQPIALTKKSFDTLLHLVRNRGRLVSRDELLAAVWPDVVVEEGNLHWTISAVRKALGDGNGGETFIETVRGQGYRFLPEALDVSAPVAPSAAREPVSS